MLVSSYMFLSLFNLHKVMDKIVPEYKMAVLRHILKKVHGKQKLGQLKAQHSVKQLNCFFFPGVSGFWSQLCFRSSSLQLCVAPEVPEQLEATWPTPHCPGRLGSEPVRRKSSVSIRIHLDSCLSISSK